LRSGYEGDPEFRKRNGWPYWLNEFAARSRRHRGSSRPECKVMVPQGMQTVILDRGWGIFRCLFAAKTQVLHFNNMQDST
jgi:hypothetical protein